VNPTPPRPRYIPVHKRRGDPYSGIWCKVDPVRLTLEFQERGVKHYVDLADIIAEWLARQGQEAA
jgi:hypothetical protein